MCYTEPFLAIALANSGVWLPIDPGIFVSLQANCVAIKTYTYEGFVWGGHSHLLPSAYVNHFFKAVLLRRCKANCGVSIPCSDAGQVALGGEAGVAADTTTAVALALEAPPLAYPQYESNFCVTHSAASALHAAGDAASAAYVAWLAPQVVGLPVGADRVHWLMHHCAQRLQRWGWQTLKLKLMSAGRPLDASALLALLLRTADAGIITVFQMEDSVGNVQHCAAAAVGWLFDPNKARALPLSDAGLDACCLGGARLAFVVKGFQMQRRTAKRVVPDGKSAPAAAAKRLFRLCG